MKTFIAAQIGLAPLAAFWLLLGFGSPGAALAVGLAASLAMTAWRWTRREVYLIEIGALACFGAMAAIDLAAPALESMQRAALASPVAAPVTARSPSRASPVAHRGLQRGQPVPDPEG